MICSPNLDRRTLEAMILTQRGVQGKGNSRERDEGLREMLVLLIWSRTRVDVRRDEDAVLESLEVCRDVGISEEVTLVEEVVRQLVLVEGDVGVRLGFDSRLGSFGFDDFGGFGVGCDVKGAGRGRAG